MNLDGLAQDFDRLAHAIGFAQDAGQVVDGLWVAGAGLQEFLEELFRQVVQFEAVGEAAQVVDDADIVGHQLERGFEAGQGAGQVAGLFAGDGQDVPGLAALLVDVQRLQCGFAAALPVAALEGQQRFAQQDEGVGAFDVVGLGLQNAQHFARAGIAQNLCRGIKALVRLKRQGDRAFQIGGKRLRGRGGRLQHKRLRAQNAEPMVERFT